MSKIVALLNIKYSVYVLSLFSLNMQMNHLTIFSSVAALNILYMCYLYFLLRCNYTHVNHLTIFSSVAAGHPWIKFYTESKVKIPASMPKRRKRILAAKGERSEESPLPLTPCKRERRAPCTNSIPTEYGEDESFFGPLQGFPHPKQPELHIRAAGKYDLVDALAAAISQIRLSEPKRKRSRLCVLACPVPLQCSSNIKTSLCTAF